MKWLLSAAAAAATLALTPLAAAASAPVAASWQKHETAFAYMGFTSYYSCDGFEETLKFLLQSAGARSDAKVRAACTAPMGGAQRISTANLTFYTLVPAPPISAKPSGPGAAVTGVWRAVKLRAGSPWRLGAGDCELVEQFAHDLLPMFTIRKVDNRTSCVPHEANPFGINLKFEVLAPPPAKPAPQGGKSPPDQAR